MNYEMTNCVIRARKDRIGLQKRFCERQGLILIPLSYRIRFGFCGYRVAIPKDFSNTRREAAINTGHASTTRG